MDRDQIHRLDLNLLLAFDALIAERNVTRAAERMSVGQSAMSASLARLRAFFGDPLLVRDGRFLVPTPRALELTGPFGEALDLIDATLRADRGFDARTDRRTFTVMASDYVLLVMLGRLLSELGAQAPNLQFRVRPVDGDHAERLRRGEVDLLIIPEDVTSDRLAGRPTTLFTDRFVCAVDADHPDVGETLSEAQFHTLPMIACVESPLPLPLDLRLREIGIERAVEIGTQSIALQPFLLRDTRFVALIPERLGRLMRDRARIRLVEPPWPLAGVREGMFWSPHNDTDPANRWLRERVSEFAGTLGD